MKTPCVFFALAFLANIALCCDNYRKEADGACADTCLASSVGICPRSLIVSGGGLDKGLCADKGYTVADGTVSQKAGPCGTLKFNKYTKPSLSATSPFLALAALDDVAPASDNSVVPESDDSCKWEVKSCAPSAFCSFQPAFGDLSLDDTCRLRSRESVECPAVTTVDVDPATYFNGRWFEVAASSGFKTKFEKGSSCISADYTFNACDSKHPVVVVNNGVQEDGSLNTAIGKARAAGPGQFEVSFFGPFYGPYWVIHTTAGADEGYGVAIVFSCSSGGQDMWILSRTPTLPSDGPSYEELLDIARNQGVDVDALDMVKTKQGDDCSYPRPEDINNKPASDDDCKFGWTGCGPSAWCSYQFKWGDLTPNKSCRMKPTTCAATEVADATTSLVSLTSSSSSCPAGVTTVDVDPATYFDGRWYEVAASSGFKTQYEAGSSCISADYTFNACDSKHPVVVVNNGVQEDGSLNTAIGKARKAGGAGKFEVSFFGPFYGPYWVIHTTAGADEGYGVAIVFSCSSKNQDMWVLSRTPTLPSNGPSYEELLDIARGQGIDVDALEMVKTKQGGDCSYPRPEDINNKPDSDAGCTFSLTGCSPGSWCSYQPKWGDLTPSKSCRLKPTTCDATVDDVSKEASSSSSSTSSLSGGKTLFALGVVGGVCSVLAVAGVALITRRRRSPLVSKESLLDDSTTPVV